ncbi:hypothetical protein AB0A94_34385 [Streptomyces sp. NPDC044984]
MTIVLGTARVFFIRRQKRRPAAFASRQDWSGMSSTLPPVSGIRLITDRN